MDPEQEQETLSEEEVCELFIQADQLQAEGNTPQHNFGQPFFRTQEEGIKPSPVFRTFLPLKN